MGKQIRSKSKINGKVSSAYIRIPGTLFFLAFFGHVLALENLDYSFNRRNVNDPTNLEPV